MREWLVARDEDDLVNIGARTPSQVIHRILDHPAAILVTAVRLQGEEVFRNLVEIRRQRLHTPDPAGLLRKTGVTVFVKRDLYFRRHAVLLRLDEFVADLPELTLGLLDQAIHAVAGVEEDGDLHEWLLVLVRRWFRFF